MPAARDRARRIAAFLLAVFCAACSSQYATHWNGRRGYDGNGDYGYDLAASEAAALRYRARAADNYPVPGSPDDLWGPYIREATARFGVPELWIREVIRQESGGRLYGDDGALITSSAGAMGLMQVMPRTYETLRDEYGLGNDPYEPRNNILAGTAYIREMYDRYGAPAFLAAYNAGPDRVDAYLANGVPLPDETVNYLASAAPRLGSDVAMTGPLAAFAGGATPPSYVADTNYAYAGIGTTQAASYDLAQARTWEGDPSLRAFDGGGLVTPTAPTGLLTDQVSGPSIQVAQQPIAPAPVSAPTIQAGQWGIQVGAFGDPAVSRAAIERARTAASELLMSSQPAIIPAQRGAVLYRARLLGLSAGSAAAACAHLSAAGFGCFIVPPGS